MKVVLMYWTDNLPWKDFSLDFVGQHFNRSLRDFVTDFDHLVLDL